MERRETGIGFLIKSRKPEGQVQKNKIRVQVQQITHNFWHLKFRLNF